jgi:hypothetical protein
VNRLCRCSLALQFFVAAYLCAAFGLLPNPRYYPTLHQWTFDSIKGEPAMNWYGYTSIGLLAGAVGYFAGGLYAKLQERLKFDLAGTSAWLACLVFAGSLMWHEGHKWF